MSFSVNSINSISSSFATTQNVTDSSKRIANTEFVSNSIELHKHAIGAHASLEISHGSEETVASELNRLSSSVSGGVVHRLTDTGSGVSLIKSESGILEKLINGTKIELTKIESGGIRIDVSGSDVTQTQLDLINSLSGGEASQYYAGNNTYKSFDLSVSSSSLSSQFSKISSSFLIESASTTSRLQNIEESTNKISSSLNQVSSSLSQFSSSVSNEISQSNFIVTELSSSISTRMNIEEGKSIDFSASIGNIEITQSGIINEVIALSASLFNVSESLVDTRDNLSIVSTSFVSASASLSTRVTTNEQDIISVSSSLGELSSSFATRITDTSASLKTVSDKFNDVSSSYLAHTHDHTALSNVLPSTASQNHLTDDELEFFGTLPSTISDLMSNVEEVDADFVSISYNPSGAGASRGLYSGIMSVAVPTQANTGLTTWVNQGGATVTDASVGIQIINPTTSTSNDNIRGLVMPVPATPYTLTALLELASIAGNYPSALIGWADSTSTKTHLVTLCGDNRSGLISPTSYTVWSLSGAPTFAREGRRAWLQFADDGTTITVRWSFSGVYWHTLYSGAKASSHLGASGYNQLFIGASSASITGVATLLSWSIS